VKNQGIIKTFRSVEMAYDMEYSYIAQSNNVLEIKHFQWERIGGKYKIKGLVIPLAIQGIIAGMFHRFLLKGIKQLLVMYCGQHRDWFQS
jgi:hypothetical protein